MPIQKHTHEHSPIHTLICTCTHIGLRPTLKYALTLTSIYTKNERENLLFNNSNNTNLYWYKTKHMDTKKR